MNTIVETREGRVGSFLAFLLMIGISVGLIVLAGGIGGWVFGVLFFLISLLPLDSLIRPETAILTLNDGVLQWSTTKQGKTVEEGSLPVRDIQKVKSIKSQGRRTLSVEIQLETRSGDTVYLPMALWLSVNEKTILSALKAINASIAVEEIRE
jgi:hypothetical protein